MPSDGQNEKNGLEQSFVAAMKAVKKSEESQASWEHLEELAESLGEQDAVANAYLDALSTDLKPGVRDQLFDAAIRYHDEWFGDDPAAMNRVLSKVLEIDPSANWAFDRLTVVLSAAQQWDELLSAHDRMLESIEDPIHRKTLLSEAANVAKDFARDPDRAVKYMLLQLELDQANDSLAASAQRLLERGKNWATLIALWRGRTKVASTKQARTLRIQIAECYLDNLDDPGRALEELSALLDESPGDLDVCKVLERVLVNESAEDQIKLQALGRLTSNYDAAKQKEDAIEAIETVIGEIAGEHKNPLYREAGMRLATLGKDVEAMGHFASLMVAKPSDLEARKQLRHLTARSKEYALSADALKRAASECEESTLKVALMVEAAHIYWDDLSDSETAIELFTRVLEVEDVDQTTALSAAHSLNELQSGDDKQEARLQVLEQLAKLERSAEVRKAVLGEAAKLASTLGDEDKALEFWQSRLESDEADLEAMRASIELLENKEDWDRLVAGLEKRAGADILPAQRRVDLIRIAAIQEENRKDTDAAIETWLRILNEFGPEADVLQHLNELMESLERWSELSEILEKAMGDGHATAAFWLSRLGDIHLINLSNPVKAVDFYTGALHINHGDEVSRSGLEKLCEVEETAGKATQSLAAAYAATDDHQLLVDLTESRLKASSDNWSRIRILEETARLQEVKLQDRTSALKSLARAFQYAPENVRLEQEIMRLAEGTDNWSITTQAFTLGAESIEDQPARASELRLQTATILENRVEDISGAISMVQSVLDTDPSNLNALKHLADLERSGDPTNLVKTLLRIDNIVNNDLDALREACEKLLETSDDYEQQRELLNNLYQKASRLWDLGASTKGTHQPDSCTAWAIENCKKLDAEANLRSKTVQMLLNGSKLPFDDETALNMRFLAANLLASDGDRSQAIDVYRSVLSEMPQNIEIIQSLASLLRQENRDLELLATLKDELTLTEDPDKRLELRLEITKLLGAVEGSNERFHTIAANLKQEPGHANSIEALGNLLSEQVSYADAIDLLTDQAEKLEQKNDNQGAAKLWTFVAKLRVLHFSDSEKASYAYTRVVELDCTNEALDALSELAIERGAHQEAATWLKKRLTSTTDSVNRIQVMLKLAKARLQAGEKDRAVTTLETAFEEAPRNAEVRRLLTMQYRNSERWEPLIEILTSAAEHVEDKNTILTQVREVQDICQNQLEKPELAVPILERATSLVDDNQDLKLALAEGRRAIGQLDEAQELTDEIIKGFGRRRSVERAAAHLLLARIANDQDDGAKALEELETASTMDSQNLEIWQMLAEMARKAGELEKAERAYRTLLIILRRTTKTKGEERISQSEVLVELAWIARERDDTEQADELCESAFEILKMGEKEMKRFIDKLLEWERPDLIERAVEARLARATKPRQQGMILCEYADLLEEQLDSPNEAFDARMRAVDQDPGQPAIHDALYAVAQKNDQIDIYFEKLKSLLTNTRRGTDTHIRCELLLRLSAIMENDKNDLEAAREYYLEAEATGVREVDVWKAGIRIASALKDEDEQTRLLTNLSSLGEDVESETRADVFYRLAEFQLASEDTLREGVLSMENALQENPRYARAARILSRACETHSTEEQLLGLYERVARQTEDSSVLLDAFERRAACESSTPELVREGVQVALELEETDRAEALMLRAIELSSDLLDGMAHVPWALMGLARLRRDTGDLAGAVKWTMEAAEVADPTEVFTFARELTAMMDDPKGDLTLATQLYERLFERNPSSREVWEPLTELYTRLGDTERLERVLEEVQEYLSNPEEQRALRLKQCQLSLTNPEREEGALEMLKEIVAEDPSNQTAMTVLMDYLEGAGKIDELHELLEKQYKTALEEKDQTAIRDAALGFGEFLRQSESEEAVSVFRTALERVPEDHGLMKKLLESLGNDSNEEERAKLLEKMLPMEPDENVPSIALEAAGLFEALGNGSAALRALDLGFKRAPGNDQIRQLLIEAYREGGDQAGLAETLAQAAESQPDDESKSTMLKEAADIHLNSLSDPTTAANILRRVIEIEPGKPAYLLDLAKALSASGNHQEAIDELAKLLEEGDQSELHVEILRTRAQITTSLGDIDQALADLESAFAINPEAVAEDLENALHKHRTSAASAGDVDGERDIVLRLTDLMLQKESDDDARQLLENWLKKEPLDNNVKRRLLELHKKAERWVDVASICAALVEIEEGETQTEAALQLAQACLKTDTPELARPGLELTLEHQPENADIRDALYSIYEKIGAHQKLGALLLQDANNAEDTDTKADMLSRAGLLFLEVEDVEAAESALAESLMLKPGDISVIIALVDVYLASENADAAAAQLEMGLSACKEQKDSRLAVMQVRMARLSKLQSDAAAEIKWLKQAVLSDRDNGEIAMELVNRAEELEEWDTVIWALRTIARMKKGSPLTKAQIALRQAKISLIRGDERKAALFARQAKQEDPDCEETLTLLKELGLD